ncbi:MAG: FG-GAP-like repeat-containing protein, partial [Pseudomonadota bacterium]
TLSADADGAITLQDGSVIDFSDIEQIVFQDTNPTDITFTSGSPTISSGAINGGTVIATATGVDADGDAQTYSLTDDANGLFAIDSATGAISIIGDTPSFSSKTGSSNPFNGVDEGFNSTIEFADIDNDGDMDAFIGESGGVINYYENTGTNSNPTFAEKTGSTNPFNGVDVGDGSEIELVDIDNDGDLDAFIGENEGVINYYENTGTNSSPTFAEKTGSANPFNGVDVGNGSQIELVDIDNDGDLDAFVGEFNGIINYFENTGTNSSPTFAEKTGSANPFNGVDVGDRSSLNFADLDKDGDLDAFVGEFDGIINYFENTGTNSTPTFVERTGSANPFNGIDIGDRSAPVFVDIDNDGDLDTFIGENDGTLNYYQNDQALDASTVQSYTITVQTKDDGGAAYSENLTVQTGTTGNDTITGDANSGIIYGFEGNDTLRGNGGADTLVGGTGDDTFIFWEGHGTDSIDGGSGGTDLIQLFDSSGGISLGTYGVNWTVSLSSGSITNTGSDKLTLSADADGAITLQDGSVINFTDIEEIQFAEYAPTDIAFVSGTPAISSGAINGGTVIVTATGFDADGDTQTYSLTDDASGMFTIDNSTGAISILGNTPSFSVKTGSSNPFNGVDFGVNPTVVFADIDNDGDMDAFVGRGNGTINYYENTGTNSSPTFVDKTGSSNPFNGVDVVDVATPKLVDIDNDGDLDTFIGRNDGAISYYENTGTISSPTFSEKTGSSNPFNGVDVGFRSQVDFADLDNDGDLDAFVGEFDGIINYYENTGTISSPTFAEKTGSANPFNGIDIGSLSSLNFADLDKDGDLDAFIGEEDGIINYYENTGTNSSPTFAERTGSANPFNGIDIGANSTPTLVDIDNDGDLDTFITEQDGFINFYENDSSVDASTAQSFTITVQTKDAGGATYSENLTIELGTSGNDSITSDANNGILYGFDGNDTLNGGSGDDIFVGGAGNDALTGGDGVDTADYSASSAGVTANLSTGSGSGGDAAGDTYTTIENIIGSANIDTLTGDANDNTIQGNAGNDIIVGNNGNDVFIFWEGHGTDTIDGGAGASWTDSVYLYDLSGGNNIGTYGVDWTVNLTSGSVTVGGDKLTLGQDADGTITLQDGATVNFTDIEEILF